MTTIVSVDPLPDVLRRVRRERGLSQKEAAHAVGVQQVTWSRWENRERDVRELEHLEAIAGWLRRPLQDVVLAAYGLRADGSDVEALVDRKLAEFDERVEERVERVYAALRKRTGPPLAEVLAMQEATLRAGLPMQVLVDEDGVLDVERFDVARRALEEVDPQWRDRWQAGDDGVDDEPRPTPAGLATAAKSGKPSPTKASAHDEVLAGLAENPPVDAPRDDPRRKGRAR